MKFREPLIICTVSVTVMLLSALTASAQDVTVLLRSGAYQCKTSAQSLTVSDRYAKNAAAGSDTLSLTWSGGAAADENGNSYALPLTISGQDGFAFEGRNYKGILILENGSSGFNIVNKVDVEYYIKGVLKDEMNPKWPQEALKAQAVLARTYVLTSQKHGSYNVCADPQHCQLYGGIDESPSIKEAVEATQSETLSYSGKPAQVFYFADSGGTTASSKTVWGKDIPYLISRPEPVAYTSPSGSWQATISKAQAASRLNAAGISIGTLSSLRVYSRDESGRAQQIELSGSGGRQLIPASKFRTLLGANVIKSTLFDFSAMPAAAFVLPYTPAAAQPIYPPRTANTPAKTYPNPDRSTMPSKPEDKLFWMAKNKIFTTAELMSMIGKEKEYGKFIAEGEARMSGKAIPATQKTQTIQPQAVTIPAASSAGGTFTNASADGDVITIFGRGFGHGVGMPQWGAKALAEAGWNYRQILEYYFPGTTVERGIM